MFERVEEFRWLRKIEVAGGKEENCIKKILSGGEED